MVKHVIILGSTGSIGTQALQVIADNPDKFHVVGIAAAGRNPQLIIDQAQALRLNPDHIAVANPQAAETIAAALGGAVGVTRDVVDSGYYPGQFQIGQTGVTVSPDLYIGLGVSGAIQHKSGMQTAKKIIVINNDEDAPLFEIADLGVVGDLFDIAPKLIEEIKKRG